MEKVEESDVLINRTQMLQTARRYNIFISKGTIHRWANEPDFPRIIGKRGKHLLYRKEEFNKYLSHRINRLQDEH